MDDDTGLSGPESGNEPWFEQKRFGYGASLPIAWQGWVLMAGFIAVTLGLIFFANMLASRGDLLAILPFVVLVVALMWFVRACERHTRGGWRWRWGDDD